METWTVNDIQGDISVEDFAKHEELLLKNLELKTVSISKVWLGSPNDLWATLMAFFAVNSSAVWSIVLDRMDKDALDAFSNSNLAMFAATLHIQNAAKLQTDAFKTAISTGINFLDVAHKAASNAVGKVQLIFKFGDKDYLDKASGKLRYLFVLAYISQCDSSGHYQEIFDDVKEVLDADTPSENPKRKS